MNTLRPISLLLVTMICLTPSGRAVCAEVANTQAKKHCLWRVQNSTNTVFLLGSVHVLKKDMYPLDPKIEDAYKQANVAMFEADFREMESPEFQVKMITKATFPADDSLKQHVSKQTYSMLHSNLEARVGVGSLFDQYKPWMAAVGLVGIELQSLGYDATNGIDKHYFDRALREKKSILPLETSQSQMDLLTGLSDAECDAFLAQTLQEMAKFRSLFNDLMKAWQTGDTKALESILLDSFRDYPSIHKKFLLDRNRSWIPKNEKLLKTENRAIVIVGAAHLIGKESVVELLQKKGYAVEQQ